MFSYDKLIAIQKEVLQVTDNLNKNKENPSKAAYDLLEKARLIALQLIRLEEAITVDDILPQEAFPIFCQSYLNLANVFNKEKCFNRARILYTRSYRWVAENDQRSLGELEATLAHLAEITKHPDPTEIRYWAPFYEQSKLPPVETPEITQSAESLERPTKRARRKEKSAGSWPSPSRNPLTASQ